MERPTRHLSHFGLSEYEASVYITLLQAGPCSIRELWFKSRVPRTKIYPTVKSLERKDLVVVLPEKPIKMRAAPPTSLAPTLKQVEENVRHMRKTLAELQKIHDSSKSSESLEKREMWILKESEAVQHKLEEMIRDAAKEVFAILTDEGLELLSGKYSDALRSASYRDVKVRLVVNATKDNVEYVKKLNGLAEGKYVDTPPSNNVCIADGKETLLFKQTPATSIDHPSSLIGVYTEDQNLSDTFRQTFQTVAWTKLDTVSNVLPVIENEIVPDEKITTGFENTTGMFLYSLCTWLNSQFGKDRAQTILTDIGRRMVQMLVERESTRVLRSSLEESLKTLSDLFKLYEGVSIRFKLDSLLRLLTYEISGPLTTAYWLSAKDGLDIPPSVLGVTMLGLIDQFGYDSKVLKTVYDENSDVWIVQRKIIEKRKTS